MNLFEIRDVISKKFPKEKEKLAYILAYIEALKHSSKYNISKDAAGAKIDAEI